MTQGSDTPEDIKAKCAARRAEVAENRGKRKNPVGRPKGGTLSVKKFNDLLESEDYDEANAALMVVAKDPDHKHFASMQKLLQDRAAHLSNFDKSGGNANQTPVVNINISTVGETAIAGEVIEDG